MNTATNKGQFQFKKGEDGDGQWKYFMLPTDVRRDALFVLEKSWRLVLPVVSIGLLSCAMSFGLLKLQDLLQADAVAYSASVGEYLTWAAGEELKAASVKQEFAYIASIQKFQRLQVSPLLTALSKTCPKEISVMSFEWHLSGESGSCDILVFVSEANREQAAEVFAQKIEALLKSFSVEIDRKTVVLKQARMIGDDKLEGSVYLISFAISKREVVSSSTNEGGPDAGNKRMLKPTQK